MATSDLESLAARIGIANVGDRLQLEPPLQLGADGQSFGSVVVEKEMKSRTRPRLLRFEGSDKEDEAASSSSSRRFLLKQEDLTLEASAMALLEDINARFREQDLQYCGVPVVAQTYGILPIGTTAGLVEFVPGAVTLGRLKRECKSSGKDAQMRVSEYLQEGLNSIDATWGTIAACISRLVATTAAYLVTNFVLGVADGHEDNVMLLRDGTLFRVDFGHVFGEGPGVDSPLIWLPKAVKVAIGKSWRAVEQLCSVALTIAAPWIVLGSEHQDLAWQSIYATVKRREHVNGATTASQLPRSSDLGSPQKNPLAEAPEVRGNSRSSRASELPSNSSETASKVHYGAVTLRWFLALLELDLALGTAAVRYAWLLRRTGWAFFKEQFDCIDSAWLKTIKNLGHDYLGYNDVANADLIPPMAGRATKEDRKLVFHRLKALLAVDDQELTHTLRRAASGLFASSLDPTFGQNDRKMPVVDPTGGNSQDPSVVGVAKQVVMLLAQCEVVPLAARLLADDQHTQWLLPCITARAVETLEGIDDTAAQINREHDEHDALTSSSTDDNDKEGHHHHDGMGGDKARDKAQDLADDNDKVQAQGKRASEGESSNDLSTAPKSRLGPLGAFQTLPTSLVRDTNKLLRYATNKVPSGLPGSKHRPKAFRVLLRLAGASSEEVQTLRHRHEGADDNDDHEDSTCNRTPNAWGAICRGGMDEGTNKPTPPTEAERLVELAALHALQAMEEEGAEHAEEVFRLMEESLHNEDLAQEALKTLCLMAPASPLNAYKRGERSAVAADTPPHQASERLARMLSA